jgi:type I restriction enzyme S subunit
MCNKKNLPPGWQMKRLEDLAIVNPPRQTPDTPDTEVSLIRMADVSTAGDLINTTICAYREIAEGLTSFGDGDILVAKITPCFENRKGAIVQNLKNNLGFGSTEFHVIRANGRIDRNLLFYHTMTDAFRRGGEAAMTGSAGQKRVPKRFIERYPIPLPPPAEQEKIVAILCTWDKAIALTERVIEKNQELFRRLMKRLLTKNTSHWHTSQLHCLAKISMGQSPKSIHYNAIQTGLPLIQGKRDIQNRKLSPRMWTEVSPKTCDTGDIIMTVRAPSGLIARSTQHACLGRGVCAINPVAIDKGFLYYTLVSLEPHWTKLAQGSTFKAIGSNDIKHLPIHFPPNPQEQKKIAALLREQDKKIQLLEQKHAKLNEQKKGILKQLLSGDLRVKP